MEKGTYEWQKWMLSRLVESAFVRQSKDVKGAYTTGDYCIWLLNFIFGPDKWSHHIKSGPELVPINEQLAYSQVVIELSVTFANGETVTHHDIGIWPFTATNVRKGGTLNETAPERWEQVVKSAVTDGVKACVEYLGTCFRPLSDQELERHIQQRLAKESLEEKGLGAKNEDPEQSRADLFGDERYDGPGDISELYTMAKIKWDLNSQYAANILQKHLREQHGDGSKIETYLEMEPNNIKTLWAVLVDHEKAKEAELD